ncbi:MAG: glycosyltransferase family 9 protein [Oligoflexales bacterium]
MKRVLVIQLRQLGDILLTTPILRSLKNQGAHVTFLCHAMGYKYFSDQKTLPFDELLTYSDQDNLRTQYSLIKTLKQAQYDIVIDCMGNPKSAFFSLCTRSPQRISWETRRRWAFHTVVKRQTGQYIVEEKNTLLAAAGFQTSQDFSLFQPFIKSSAVLNHLLKHLDQKSEQPRILMSPASRKKERRWPEEQFVALAQKLQKEWNAHILWAWGPGEYEYALRLYRNTPKTTLLPKMNIQELTSLLAHCDFFMGPSNGPSHLAIAAKTPSFQLHGPTHAIAWNPPNKPEHQALQVGPIAKDRELLSDLTADTVWDSCQAMKKEIDKKIAERNQKTSSLQENENSASFTQRPSPSLENISRAE